jgi:hypothetical protein
LNQPAAEWQAVIPAPPATPAAVPTVALAAVQSGPARVGTPFVVDLTLTGFDARPVYALDFDVLFDQQYLRLIGIQSGTHFAAPPGSFTRTLDLAAANAAGKAANIAAVRLAAAEGLASGTVVRLVFMPLKMTPGSITTRLEMLSVHLADLDSDIFNASLTTDLVGVVIEKQKLFVPVARK